MNTVAMPLLLMLLLIPDTVAAGEIEQGDYYAGQASGALTFKRNSQGGLDFKISTEGVNGHSCEVEGELLAGKLQATVPADDKTCVIRFSHLERGIKVEVPEAALEACSYFCGARASFDREYLQIPPACVPKAVDKSYAAFKKAYVGGQFAKARDLLAPLLQRCSDHIDPQRLSSMRNDLAITLHHVGDDAGCLKVLDPLKSLASQSDQEIEDDYAVEPILIDGAKRVARAARTNLAICSAPKALVLGGRDACPRRAVKPDSPCGKRHVTCSFPCQEEGDRGLICTCDRDPAGAWRWRCGPGILCVK